MSPSRYENTFQKGFWYQLGDTEKDEIGQFWISQKWLKISTQKFHGMLIFFTKNQGQMYPINGFPAKKV